MPSGVACIREGSHVHVGSPRGRIERGNHLFGPLSLGRAPAKRGKAGPCMFCAALVGEPLSEHPTPLSVFLLQGPEHPNPGKPFTARGFPRQCYLPDNAQGRKVKPHATLGKGCLLAGLCQVLVQCKTTRPREPCCGLSILKVPGVPVVLSWGVGRRDCLRAAYWARLCPCTDTRGGTSLACGTQNS